VDNRLDQLDAAAAGAEEPLDELDLSEELDESDEPLDEPSDEEEDEEEDSVLLEELLGTELFPDSRLSVR
jgi:hypothetical protein